MDLKLGFKVTRDADEFTSSEFQFEKDQAGPLFQSAETNSRFILTAHLKGYTRGNINIGINEEGAIMVITGVKPIQETVMVGWKVIKKDVEITKFTKAFKIPEGVILDKIKTKFNEEECILVITMPKRVKGILGIGIEAVKEPELLIEPTRIHKKVTFQDKGAEPSADHESVSMDRKEQLENEKEMPQKPLEKKALAEEVSQETEVEKHAVKDGLVPRMKTEMPNVKPMMQETDDMFQEKRESHSDEKPECTNQEGEKANRIQENEETNDLSRTGEEDEEKPPESKWKIGVPVVAGSAVILSLVVFVIHSMRTKNQTGTRKG